VYVDLDVFAALVDQRRSFWEPQGINAEFKRGPTSWPKPSASVRCENASTLAELTIWTSGEGELQSVRRDTNDPIVHQHYDLTSEAGLLRCLDDLTEILLKDD
jgi:hypothetical protein